MEKIRRFLHIIGSLTRWQEWYDSKVPLFFLSFYYLCLVEPLPDGQVLAWFALVTGFACLFLAFTYSINDLSDREQDRRAGKKKIVAQHPGPVVAAICVLGLAGAAIPLIQAREHPSVLWVAGLAYFFAVFYSMPPLRFKERGVWGVVVAALVQRPLPILVVLALFDRFQWDTWALFSLFGLVGVRWILVHQITDLRQDLGTGVRTFATEVGYKRARRLLDRIVFPLEALSVAILCIWLAASYPGLWLLPVVYLLDIAANWVLWYEVDSPYNLAVHGRWLLNDFYYVLCPMTLAVVLALSQPIFWLILVINILWQSNYLIQRGRMARQLFQGKLKWGKGRHAR